ncbi:nucleotidyltransferase [Rhodobacteraceae bacterium]|nr:nucleotidyltransferase [Paracoccaceae bacterium]
MNKHVKPPFNDATWRRRAEIYKFLEEICQDLDLLGEQTMRAKRAYEAVAEWLAGSLHPLLSNIDVYPQGSTALGTAVRPLGRDEFDVDLICLILKGHAGMAPEDIKKIIGDRLREHATYAKMLVEKKRCWRLDYAGDFHLDLSGTIRNIQCVNGGELVTDKKLHGWHPTHPKGYRQLFEKRAQLMPRMRRMFAKTQMRDQASIEPFPDPSIPKGVLRRVVQLLKRHRDNHFLNVKEDIAPISIIITTLAMRSYDHCVGMYEFDDELDVLISTIRMMPHFIDKSSRDGRQYYAVWNETTQGENFADRWNLEPQRAAAFYAWHGKALSDFQAMRDAEGLDGVTKTAKSNFGDKVVTRVMDARTNKISAARKSSSLLVAPAIGLTTKASAAAQTVRKNTFFGD